MTLAEWTIDVAELVSKVREEYVAKHGQMPTLTLFRMKDPAGNEENVMHPMFFTSNEQKSEEINKLRVMLDMARMAGGEILYYSLVSEAWMSSIPKEDWNKPENDKTSDQYVPTSQRPDREEVVIFHLESKTEKVVTVYDIDGVNLTPREEKFPSGMNIGGSLTNFVYEGITEPLKTNKV